MALKRRSEVDAIAPDVLIAFKDRDPRAPRSKNDGLDEIRTVDCSAKNVHFNCTSRKTTCKIGYWLVRRCHVDGAVC